MRTATIYNFLLEANVMASIAIVLMVVVRKFFRKSLGNRVLYFAWLLVAIRLLCPLALPNPAVNEIRPAFSTDEAVRPIAGQLQVRFTDAGENLLSWVRKQTGRTSPIARKMNAFVDSAYDGMLSIRVMRLYLAGVGAVLCWFVISNLRFCRKLKKARIEAASGMVLEQYEQLCQKRGMKPIPVYYTDPLPSACLVGVFHPYIALPLTVTPREAPAVLAHEVCHAKGHDQWWGVVRLLCCAVHWFNPLVWVAAQMSRTDGELCCDDRVTEKLDSQQRLAYANVLVLAASKRSAPGIGVLATGMTMTGRKLKTRVNAILHSGQAKRGFALAFALVASMSLVGAFATAEYKQTAPIPMISEQGASVQHRAISDSEDAIAYAQDIWKNEYVQPELSDLDWMVNQAGQRYEVKAVSKEMETQLLVAFMPDGEIVYLCNLASGGRDATLTDKTLYLGDDAALEKYAIYALNAVDALNPGLGNQIESVGNQDECQTDLEHFISMDGLGPKQPYRMVVETAPTIRLVYFVNLSEMSDYDVDRLEPGNG